MPILHRYIARETLRIFLATSLILLAIIVSFRLSSLLSSAAAGDLSLAAVWQVIVLMSIRFLLTLMPVALIIAITLTLGRLYNEQELYAAFACGMSRAHIRRALLWIVLPLALLMTLGNVYLLPYVSAKQDSVNDQAQQEAAMLLFQPNEFRRLADGSVVYAELARGDQLGGFFVYRQTQGEPSAIVAPEGKLSAKDGVRHLHLYDGFRTTWDSALNPEESNFTTFSEATLRLPEQTAAASHRLRNVPTHALDDSPAHIAELQNRLNPTFALLIFVLLMPLLTQTAPRSGRYQRLIPIFVLFALYLNVQEFISKAVEKGAISPWPGSLWLHIALVGLLVFVWLVYARRRA
ncbi:LPS export ABC transporter permease LptF [Suttonella sp. R2A3]|uniref:LPS export ABC transporter permease LptF n=1 Tax=Suttonella sp. R2A3 TaxID=2908648 RepID=UPI001F350527|nr:LPS export ABC transporter permease LptF [Suttonella sp. R2A3]UJF23980.1 LPS export ABC transporter permease LptF [Suttonella sp. R2A3]